MEKFWSLLEREIEQKFGLDRENEWVQVHISPRGKVHVTIVSDQNIKAEVVKQIVQNQILESKELYRVGFINIYTNAQAQELAIVKREKKNNYLSWSEAIHAVGNDVEERNDLQIISFYSYKGGVGRTIALIETAYNLAKAGKRVLLLDLDIEAPSLHNIFKNEVGNEYLGVEYGIIEYLYRTVVQKESDVSIDNMLCHLDPQDMEGDIFLIPALKTMNSEYIYHISKLQTEQIHERNAFEKIIDHVSTKYDIDIVLIDTRAGFNQWGSLSLLSLSNQIIFVAYPNAENIEGLNIALKMLNNIGKKRYAVAMSKIVGTEEGYEKAKRLFGEIEVSQEELIPIFYSEEIAISNRYPITTEGTLRAYEGIANYILDNERIEQNKEFLLGGVKERLLEHVFRDETHETWIRSVQRFVNLPQRSILIYNFQKELHGIETGVERRRALINNDFYIVPSYSFYNPQLASVYTKILLDADMDAVEKGVNIICENIKNSALKEQFPTVKETTSYEDIVQMMNYEIRVNRKGDETEDEDYDERLYAKKKLKIYIKIDEKMLMMNPDNVVDSIRKMLTFFEKEEIYFKFLIKRSLWEKYQEYFNVLKGQVLECKVEEQDIRRLIAVNLNHQAFEEYNKYLLAKSKRAVMEEDKTKFGSYELSIEAELALVLGVRKDIKLYSSSIISYLYKWLTNTNCSYEIIIDVLKCAAAEELKEPDEQYTDRLISFTKIKEVLERFEVLGIKGKL